MKILVLYFVILFSIMGVHAETAQYYNESSGQMEVPIVTGINWISYCSLENSNLTSTFSGLPPSNGDMVRRRDANNDLYYVAEYFDGYGWYEWTIVNPIEAGVGYEYIRIGGDTTWIYDTEFYCEDCGGDGATAVVTVYVTPDYKDVALLFYIFIIPILYLFVAFKKGISTTSLSAIFLIFAFFVILFQTIAIPINYIYIIIFLFLFVLSIAGITLEKRS